METENSPSHMAGWGFPFVFIAVARSIEATPPTVPPVMVYDLRQCEGEGEGKLNLGPWIEDIKKVV
jgi:hypothetical protein